MSLETNTCAGEDEEGIVCRLCYDVETDPILDPMLRPCKCSGSMAHIHHSCLFESRVNSFHPKSLSQCVLCNTLYRTVDTKGHLKPSEQSRELYVAVAKFIFVRLLCFTIVVVIMGFAPKFVLGQDFVASLPRIQSTVANHLLRGTVSTLTCAGGWFVATLFNFSFWARLLHNPFGRFGRRFLPEKKGQNNQDMRVLLIILALSGLVYLLYHLLLGVWDVMRGANAAAGANLRNANRSLREDVARRHRVINFEDDEDTVCGNYMYNSKVKGAKSNLNRTPGTRPCAPDID